MSPLAPPTDASDAFEVVVTPDDAADVERLREIADLGGGVLVAAGAHPGLDELTGMRVVERLPRTEWFVTLADRPEAVRLDGEVPLTTALATLEPLNGAAEVAATTSVRFEHRPVIAVRPVGRGRIVTVGVDDPGIVLAHPTLGPYLRRLLRGTEVDRTRSLGVAVIGYGPYGGMGYTHGLACTETDGLHLSAAVDPATDRLDAALVDFPDLSTYASADAVAGDPDVDIAIVATPPVHHAALAIDLLRAGKHVVVEKPMCLDPADADLLIRTAAEHDRVITVHQSRRWDRDVLAIDRAIARGLLGDPFSIETFVGGFEHPCRAWHSEEAVSGGAVYDWGSHHVDWILRWFGGAPSRLLCTTHRRVWHDTTNVDQLSLWMQWDDGREATFRQSDVAAIRRPKFYLQGTEGTLEGHYRPLRDERLVAGRGHLDGWHHHAEAPVDLRLVRYEGEYGLVTTDLPPAPHPGWGFHRNLADHLLLGEPLAVRPEESRDVVRVLEAAHRSGNDGGRLVDLG